MSWDSLGREGRRLMSEGPTESDIASFTGQSAKAPIRAYAGLESAASTEDRAALAVDDLARAGGFDRANLLVVTTTGSRTAACRASGQGSGPHGRPKTNLPAASRTTPCASRPTARPT